MTTSAVEQPGAHHVIGCFAPAQDSSKLRICPPWLQEKTSPDTSLPSIKGALTPVEGIGKDATGSQSVLKLADTEAMPLWMNTNQVQGMHTETAPTVGPCTPMQSVSRQKLQNYQTPESSYLPPSLSLGIGPLERQKNRTSEAPFVTGVSKSQHFYWHQLPARSVEFATSTASKNVNRIQLEVQREGPELHKENLLCLSLPNNEKQWQGTQKSDLGLSFGHYSAQPSHPRISANPGISKLSTAEGSNPQPAHSLQWTHHTGGIHNGSSSLPDKSSLQLLKPVECPSQESNLATKSFSSMVSLPYRADGACTTSCLPTKQASSLANTTMVECVKYMQLLPVVPDMPCEEQQAANDKSGQNRHDIQNSGRRFKPFYSHHGSTSGSSHDPGGFDSLLTDCAPPCREARRPLRKKRQAAEQPKDGCVLEDKNTSAQWINHPAQIVQRDRNHVLEHTRKHEICPENTSWWDGMEKQGQDVGISYKERANLQLSPFYQKEQEPENGSRLLSSPSAAILNSSSIAPDVLGHIARVSPDAMEEIKVPSGGLKLFTTPAYAQMPKALSTFSTGEPSLPLSLLHSQKLPGSGYGKTPVHLSSSSDADWGKFLALSATPAGQMAETDTVKLLPFEQRFKQLQAFLKQCDKSDQKDCLQALRSLSSAARSGHAVELETRAIRLALEEGKELKRMKLLNVLGKIPDESPDDLGATPHGPRLPAPGISSKFSQDA